MEPELQRPSPADPHAPATKTQIIPSKYRERAKEWYSRSNLWEKLSHWGAILGRTSVLSALTLYHTLRDEDTPNWARGVIVGALGYLILPIDAIPDMIPGVGFTDDWAAIVSALGTVATYVKDVHKKKATEQTEQFLRSLRQSREKHSQPVDIPSI